MPYDATEMTPATRRAILVNELRNLPKGRVKWDFNSSCQCALHDCTRLGFDVIRGLGLDINQVGRVFSRGAYDVDAAKVTPEMVADRLEHILD